MSRTQTTDRQQSIWRVRREINLPPRTPLKVGLLGGSFNPPHSGHLAISKHALRCGLDRVIWMVSPGNPLKSQEGLAPIEQRLEACRRLTGQTKSIRVTAPEVAFRDVRSAKTLSYLQALYPSISFVWITGTDCFTELHCWYRWTELMQRVPFLIFNRSPEGRRLATSRAAIRFKRRRRQAYHYTRTIPSSAWPPTWCVVQHPLQPTRSRDLRAALASSHAGYWWEQG